MKPAHGVSPALPSVVFVEGSLAIISPTRSVLAGSDGIASMICARNCRWMTFSSAPSGVEMTNGLSDEVSLFMVIGRTLRFGGEMLKDL